MYLRIFALFILLLINVNVSAKASESKCCRPPPIDCCCKTLPHLYASLGIGQSVDYKAGSSGYGFNLPESPPLSLTFTPDYSPTPMFYTGEIGYLWTNPFALDLNNNSFLPYMSLGVQYRYIKPVTITVVGQPTMQPTQYIPYRIEQNSALLVWKIDIYSWANRVMPYVNFGLGASWNHTSQANPINPAPDSDDSPLLNSFSNTSTNWNYNLGIGLDFIIVDNFWISLGYSYDNFGDLQLGKLFLTPDPAPPPGINSFFQPVDLGNLHAHNIILSARYLFG